jgi:hypothetical protein
LPFQDNRAKTGLILMPVTHTGRRASAAASPAAGFSVFSVLSHLSDNKNHQDKQQSKNHNGGQVGHQKFDHVLLPSV